MEDREMHQATCSDCGAECQVPFKPTEGKPVRCQDCFRKNRPQRSFNGGGSRSSFGGNRGGFGGGSRSNFGGNRRFDSSPREMHKTTCSSCKNECEVPFKPTEGKPVFCKDCFMKKKNSEESSNEDF